MTESKAMIEQMTIHTTSDGTVIDCAGTLELEGVHVWAACPDMPRTINAKINCAVRKARNKKERNIIV